MGFDHNTGRWNRDGGSDLVRNSLPFEGRAALLNNRSEMLSVRSSDNSLDSSDKHSKGVRRRKLLDHKRGGDREF